MTPLTRIILDPDVMGGEPCIRGLRITVGTVVLSRPAGPCRRSSRRIPTWKRVTSAKRSPTPQRRQV